MTTNYALLSPYFLALFISIGVTIYVYLHRNSKGAFTFLILSICETVYLACFLLETFSQSLSGKIFWDNVQWLPALMFPGVYLIFMFEFIDHPLQNIRRLWWMALAVPVLVFILACLDPWLKWIRPSAQLLSEHGITSLYYPFTPTFYFIGVYTYGILLYALIITIRHLRSIQNSSVRPQLMTLLLAQLVILLGAALTLLRLPPDYLRDVSPLSIGLANLILLIGIYRTRLFNVIPIARDLVIDTMGTAIFVLDLNNRVVDANASARTMVNRSAWDLHGAHVNDLFASHPGLLEKYAERSNVHETVSFEEGNKVRYFDLSIQPIFRQENDLVGRLVTLRDITESKLVEHELRIYRTRLEQLVEIRTTELRQSEERYRAVVEHQTEFIVRWKPDGTRTFVNDAYCHYFDITLQQAISTEFMPLIAAADRTAMQERTSRLLSGVVDQETYLQQVIKPDGTTGWHEWTDRSIRDESGKVIEFQSVGRDVTERKVAEETLREAEKKYRAIFENATEGIFQTARDGRILTANPATARIFGYTSPEEFIARVSNVGELYVDPAERADFRRELDELGRTRNYEVQALRNDGELIWVSLNAHSREGSLESVLYFEGFVQDITERKQSELALQQYADRLKLLHEIDRALLSAHSPQEIAKGALTRIRQLVPCLRASVTLFDFEKKQAVFLAADFDTPQTIALTPIAFEKFGQHIIDLLLQGKPWKSSDVLDEPQIADLDIRLAQDYGVRSWLSLPLPSQGPLVGSLNLGRGPGDSFTPEEIEFARDVADQIAIVIQQNRLFEETQRQMQEQKLAEAKLRRQAEQMTVLYDIGLTITSNLDLDQILHELFERCRQLLPIDTFYIAVYDQHSGIIQHPLYYDGNQHEFLEVQERNIETTPGLSGYIIRSRETLYLPDEDDPAVQENYGIILTGSRWARSYVGTPMFFHGAVVGVLSMQKYEPEAYSPEQIRLLETIATQGAVAIENARLYQQATEAAERRAVLHNISQDIVRFSQNLEQIYRVIYDAAGKLMPCDVFIIALRNESKFENDMVYVVEMGQRYESTQMKANEGFTGAIINEGKSLILANQDEIENMKYAHGHFGSPQHVQSVVAVPMRIGNKVIGMTSAQCYQPHAYGEEEQVLLEMLSAHAATAIENTRLFQAEQARRREAETLRESLASVVGTFEFSEVIQRILDQVRRVVPYDTASVWRVDGQAQRFIGGRDLPAEIATSEMVLPINAKNSAYPIFRGELPFVLNNNVQEERDDFRNPPHNYINSWMAVPLKTKGKIIGLIGLDGKQKNQFTTHHAELAVTFADQVAVALENASLYTEVQQELTERRRAEQALRESEELYRRAIEAAGAVPYYQLHGSFGSISDVEFVGEGIRQITGFGPEEFTGALWETLVEESHLVEDLAKYSLEEAIEHVRFGDIPIWKCEYRIRARDGKIHWVFDTAVELRDENGVARGSIGMFQDITERKRAEEELRSNEEKVRELNVSLEKRVQERTEQLSAEKARIEQVVNEVATLRRLSDFLQASMTVEEACRIVIGHMESLFPKTSGALYLTGDGLADFNLVACWGNVDLQSVIQPDDCWGMRRGRVFVCLRSDVSPRCNHWGATDFTESMCLPLLAQNETLGMLCVQVAEQDDTYFTADVQNLAIASADSIALALANLRLRERLHNQSVRDPLTGLFNRRYLEETLGRETHRASRSHQPLCVIMFEVDNFKVFNNTFGHEAGDYVLRKVADTMRVQLRRSDFPCRYGGDEFTLLLPETTLEDGARRADELRKAVEALTLSYNNQALGQVTVRMGVAVYPRHGDSGEVVLRMADEASYRARAIGKNCVVVAE